MKCAFGDMVEMFFSDKVCNKDLRWRVRARLWVSDKERWISGTQWNLTPLDGIRRTRRGVV